MKLEMDLPDRTWLNWMENNLEHESKGFYVPTIRELSDQKDGAREEDADAEDDNEHDHGDVDADESENGLRLFFDVTDETLPFEPEIKALEYADGAYVSDLKASKAPTSPSVWMSDREIVRRKNGKEAADDQGDESRLLRIYNNKQTMNASDLFKALEAPVSPLGTSFLMIRLMRIRNSNLDTMDNLTPIDGSYISKD
jgi:hypothetical protein